MNASGFKPVDLFHKAVAKLREGEGKYHRNAFHDSR